jgi:hypothetical protein
MISFTTALYGTTVVKLTTCLQMGRNSPMGNSHEICRRQYAALVPEKMTYLSWAIDWVVVGSKRSPAINPWRQNPDTFFNSKSNFPDVVCGSKPTFAMFYRDLMIVRKSLALGPNRCRRS